MTSVEHGVVIYTTPWCPYCIRARGLLDSKGVTYTHIDARDPKNRAEMEKLSRRRTVPQIWINGEHIGGCDELYQLERSGALNAKLAAAR